MLNLQNRFCLCIGASRRDGFELLTGPYPNCLSYTGSISKGSLRNPSSCPRLNLLLEQVVGYNGLGEEKIGIVMGNFNKLHETKDKNFN